MMREFGLALTEAVLDGDRFVGEARKEHIVSRIRKVEAEFQIALRLTRFPATAPAAVSRREWRQ